MKLISFNCIIGLLIIFLNSIALSEEKIDIWKNNKQNSENLEPKNQNSIEVKPKQKTIKVETNNDEIKINPLDLDFSFASNPGLINFQNS